MNFDLSIVIPFYNEEKNIEPIYNEILDLNIANHNIEIIFVNNGSKDNTKKKIDEILLIHKKKNIKNLSIKTINLKKNLNYDGGIYSGLSLAKGNFLSWTHGDLQTPVKDVLNLFGLVKDKKRFFAKGYRVNDRGLDFIITEFHRLLASLILGKQMSDINAQPKMFKKEDFNLFNNPPKAYTCIDTYFYYIAIKNGFKIYTTNVVFRNRIYGKSKWKNNLITLFKHLLFNTLYIIKLKIIS